MRFVASCDRFAGIAATVPRCIRNNYKRVVLGCAYRADIVVNGCVLVEIKAIETVLAVHLQQTRTYLKLGDYRVGLLLNFGETTMKNGIHRIVNNFPDQ